MRTKKPKHLNGRRKTVFKFIVDYKQSHDGNSPTIREIIEGTDITSTSVTGYYLRQLQEMGLISMGGGNSRNINVVGGSWEYDGAVEDHFTN